MRSTCSLYVDAGYLVASAATRVARTSLRSSINVNYDALVAALISEAAECSGLPVLRVHWYDSGDGGRPDLVQERIGLLPKVKLRLGRFGLDKQQKGVDVRIALDLVAHARNGTSDVSRSSPSSTSSWARRCSCRGPRCVPTGPGWPAWDS